MTTMTLSHGALRVAERANVLSKRAGDESTGHPIGDPGRALQTPDLLLRSDSSDWIETSRPAGVDRLTEHHRSAARVQGSHSRRTAVGRRTRNEGVVERAA